MGERPKHHIVGTAGHIDHGKTSLVRALTGVDTDRLPEEKRRGITIDLGFASWSLDDDLMVSIVDVPGHERFVRTMVAGASGVDGVMLVIAADEGVMPQTREHLAICALLGVQRGVVVLTRCDLVDETMLGLAREEAQQLIAGTFLESAPVLACSSRTGTGLDEVRAAVLQMLRGLTPRDARGPAFLPIDRVFSRPGFGTVVTGSLLLGSLHCDDEVDLLPGPRGRPLRSVTLRGLHAQGREADALHAGRRVAVNLRGVETADARRGDVLVTARSRLPTRRLIVEASLLAGAPTLKEGAPLSLHIGTRAAIARVVPLGGKHLEGGDTGLLCLSVEVPVVVYPDQRFVLRDAGGGTVGTWGGGRILDPHADRGKGAHGRATLLAPQLSVATSTEERAMHLVVHSGGRGVSMAELALRVPAPAGLGTFLQSQGDRGRVIKVTSPEVRYVAADALDGVRTKLLELVVTFHQERPLLAGIASAELVTRVPPPLRPLVPPALAALLAEKRLVQHDELVRSPSHKTAATDSPTLRRLEEVLAGAQLSPPGEEELCSSLNLSRAECRDALSELKRRGRAQRLGELYFHTQALGELRGHVESHFAASEELSTADFKALAGGISRKYAIPLLEWLDGRGVTKRHGDVRRKGR